jgi:DNA repair exonuclease SbcCD ATPase subunit
MSISTSITGGSASNQLMDLLAVVANPDVYKAKLDALDAATAENKKYVEALGPASEIFQLREQTKALREEAENYQKSAIAKANADLLSAQEQANKITAAAKAKADDLIAQATATKNQVDSMLSDVQQELASASKAKSEAAKSQAIANAKALELSQALENAAAAQADAEAAKADILAKHQAFVQGL